MTAAVEGFVHAGYRPRRRGHPAVRKRRYARRGGRRDRPHARGAFRRRAARMEVSKDEAQRLKFWNGRNNAFPASATSARTTCAIDRPSRASAWPTCCWPSRAWNRRRPALRQRLPCRRRQPAPVILFDANDADQLHRCELFGADILETSVAMGGTVTGEHGVGIEKLSSMCMQFSARGARADVRHQRRLRQRRAGDPAP